MEQLKNSFTEQDVKNAQEFALHIHEYAEWNVKTKALLKITRLLAWYNSLPAKIEGHIFELKDVIDNRTDEEKKKHAEMANEGPTPTKGEGAE